MARADLDLYLVDLPAVRPVADPSDRLDRWIPVSRSESSCMEAPLEERAVQRSVEILLPRDKVAVLPDQLGIHKARAKAGMN